MEEIKHKRKKRSLDLLLTFENNYSTNFYFPIPDFLKNAFDIKYTDRVINKKKTKMLTQGDIYNFQEGDIFYDSIAAYKLSWQDAILQTKNLLQVYRASPDTVIFQKKIHGSVSFSHYTPTKDHKSVIQKQNYRCTPEEFIDILKIGLDLSPMELYHTNDYQLFTTIDNDLNPANTIYIEKIKEKIEAQYPDADIIFYPIDKYSIFEQEEFCSIKGNYISKKLFGEEKKHSFVAYLTKINNFPKVEELYIDGK